MGGAVRVEHGESLRIFLGGIDIIERLRIKRLDQTRGVAHQKFSRTVSSSRLIVGQRLGRGSGSHTAHSGSGRPSWALDTQWRKPRRRARQEMCERGVG